MLESDPRNRPSAAKLTRALAPGMASPRGNLTKTGRGGAGLDRNLRQARQDKESELQTLSITLLPQFNKQSLI